MTSSSSPETTTPFRASDFANDGTHHLLLAASGSVATIKIPSILRALSRHKNLSIRLVLTTSSLHFLQSSHDPPFWNPEISSTSTASQISQLPSQIPTYLTHLLHTIPNLHGIHLDPDEWTSPPWTRTSPILHIELRRWAHLLLIAPLSANTLSKIVHGAADNLLTSVARAWDTRGVIDGVSPVSGRRRRILVAPAMNTAMWGHPVTGVQIGVLEGWGSVGEQVEGEKGDKGGWIEVLRPQEKELACGDVGDGAMMEWTKIVSIVEEKLGLS